jgi:hypothetical protein
MIPKTDSPESQLLRPRFNLGLPSFELLLPQLLIWNQQKIIKVEKGFASV